MLVLFWKKISLNCPSLMCFFELCLFFFLSLLLSLFTSSIQKFFTNFWNLTIFWKSFSETTIHLQKRHFLSLYGFSVIPDRSLLLFPLSDGTLSLKLYVFVAILKLKFIKSKSQKREQERPELWILERNATNQS